MGKALRPIPTYRTKIPQALPEAQSLNNAGVGGEVS